MKDIRFSVLNVKRHLKILYFISVFLFTCLFIRLFVYLFIYFLKYIFIYLSIYLCIVSKTFQRQDRKYIFVVELTFLFCETFLKQQRKHQARKKQTVKPCHLIFDIFNFKRIQKVSHLLPKPKLNISVLVGKAFCNLKLKCFLRPIRSREFILFVTSRNELLSKDNKLRILYIWE